MNQYSDQSQKVDQQGTNRSIENIQEIFRDEGGRGRMRNKELEKKTQAVQ